MIFDTYFHFFWNTLLKTLTDDAFCFYFLMIKKKFFNDEAIKKKIKEGQYKSRIQFCNEICFKYKNIVYYYLAFFVYKKKKKKKRAEDHNQAVKNVVNMF